MTSGLEQSAMRKAAWRLVPFLGVAYFVNALDRSNVAVAALTMNKSLGFSAAEYGLGAGAFFWSYVLFQVPHNLMLHRIGARRWITAMILAWGLCSACTALVTGVASFVIGALPAGRRRGGLLPRRHFLHDALVPAPPSRPRDGRVLRFRRRRGFHRRADLRQHPGAARLARIARLAVDLPGRGRRPP